MKTHTRARVRRSASNLSRRSNTDARERSVTHGLGGVYGLLRRAAAALLLAIIPVILSGCAYFGYVAPDAYDKSDKVASGLLKDLGSIEYQGHMDGTGDTTAATVVVVDAAETEVIQRLTKSGFVKKTASSYSSGVFWSREGQESKTNVFVVSLEPGQRFAVGSGKHLNADAASIYLKVTVG